MPKSFPLTPADKFVFDQDRQEAFLRAYGKSLRVRMALAAAKVDWRSYRKWMREDDVFARQMDTLRLGLADQVLQAALTVAIDGYEEPVVYKGEVMTDIVMERDMMTGEEVPRTVPRTVRKWSPNILAKLMDAFVPELKKEGTQISIESDGGPPKVIFEYVEPPKTDE